MPLKSIANSDKTVIVSVLDDVCTAAGFGPASDEREAVARTLMDLYWDGYHTTEELRQAFVARVERSDQS